jgi:hypothetical protein
MTSSAAQVMMRPERCRPLATRDGVTVAVLVVALLDAGHQEHLVVHRQAEREHDDRYPLRGTRHP